MKKINNDQIERLLEDIAPLNVDALTTTCPLCYTNFLYTSTKHSLGMNIQDIGEILDMALKVGNS